MPSPSWMARAMPLPGWGAARCGPRARLEFRAGRRHGTPASASMHLLISYIPVRTCTRRGAPEASGAFHPCLTAHCKRVACGAHRLDAGRAEPSSELTRETVLDERSGRCLRPGRKARLIHRRCRHLTTCVARRATHKCIIVFEQHVPALARARDHMGPTRTTWHRTHQ